MVFVGRITRQKGLPLFLRAVAQLPPDVQIVLCAGAPDTPEIEAEVVGLVDGLKQGRDGVVWIREMLPRPDVVALLTRRDRVRLPVDLRAARHRQPRGDGLRDRGRGHRDRRHPRGRRRRRDRPAGPDRAGHRRHRDAAEPRAVRRRLRRRPQRGRGRPRAGGRDGPGRPAARDRALQLGGDRRSARSRSTARSSDGGRRPGRLWRAVRAGRATGEGWPA